MPEDGGWSKLLFTYGPFALLVFFMFVGEGKARQAWRETQGSGKGSLLVVYLGVWAAIFALVGFSLYAYFDRIRVGREVMIRGTFENLQGSESIATRHADLYLNRLYGGGHTFDYQWRLIPRAKLSAGEKVTFYFDRSTCSSEATDTYELTIDQSFFSNVVKLAYDRKNDKLKLSCAGRDSVLDKLQEEEVIAAAQKARPFELISSALAQDPVKVEQIQARLESSDPIIRRDARTELARSKEEGAAIAKAILEDPASSYRLELGAIWALNRTPAGQQPALGEAAQKALVEAAASPDETLRAEALRYLKRHASQELLAIADAKLAAAANDAAPPQAHSLAVVNLELLYNLGIAAKDRYGSRLPGAEGALQSAFRSFEKAWSLRGLAAEADRPSFAKALYGWGLALHDRSWVERRADGSRNPADVAAAQAKFRQFLAAVEQPDGAEAYPFPDHVWKARAYVENPVPESLM